jgi:hypothetical protein
MHTMDKRQQWHAWYIVVAILGITFLAQLWSASQNVAVIPYSQSLDDLNANKIAEVRMEPKLGPVSYERAPSSFLSGPPAVDGMRGKRYSDETARAIDTAVQGIVTGAFYRTVEILKAHEPTLDRGPKLLLERETLDETALSPCRDEMRVAADAVGAPVAN